MSRLLFKKPLVLNQRCDKRGCFLFVCLFLRCCLRPCIAGGNPAPLIGQTRRQMRLMLRFSCNKAAGKLQGKSAISQICLSEPEPTRANVCNITAGEINFMSLPLSPSLSFSHRCSGGLVLAGVFFFYKCTKAALSSTVLNVLLWKSEQIAQRRRRCFRLKG